MKKLTRMIPQSGEEKPKTEFEGFYLNCRDKKSGVPLLAGAINNKTLWVHFNLDMKCLRLREIRNRHETCVVRSLCVFHQRAFCRLAKARRSKRSRNPLRNLIAYTSPISLSQPSTIGLGLVFEPHAMSMILYSLYKMEHHHFGILD